MKPVSSTEILSLADYERLRQMLRPVLMAEKNRRRLAVGANLTLLFENRQTVWYQVQEIIRAERIQKEEEVQREIDTYNELLPRAGEIAATLLIEFAEAGERDAALRRLVGLDRHLWLVAAGDRLRAEFDRRQFGGDRIAAVQFVRFPLAGLDSGRLLALAEDGRIAVEADHPALSARATVSGSLARALAEDLRPD